MNLINSELSMKIEDEKENKKRTVKESIKAAVQNFIDTKAPFNVQDIKGRFDTEEVSKICNSSLIKILKSELSMSYK